MENYILNRKVVEIEKNKEYSFRIPTLFNTASCEFIFELAEDQLKEDLFLELVFRNPIDNSTSGLKVVRTSLTNSLTKVKLGELKEIEPSDYLLLACKSNQSVKFALSIIK